jgi:hypothetical protein
VDSEAKEKAFLHFLYKFSRAQELMFWNVGATLLSKFDLHLQGSYQVNWHKMLDATEPNNNRDANFFNKQVQNLPSNIFAEDKWSEMANCIQICCKKPIWMTMKQVYSRFCHFIATMQKLPNATNELLSMEEEK